MPSPRHRYTNRVTTKRNFDFKLTTDTEEADNFQGNQRTGSVEVILSPPAKVLSSNSKQPVEDIVRDSPVPLLLNNPNGRQNCSDSKYTDPSDVTREEDDVEDKNVENEISQQTYTVKETNNRQPVTSTTNDEGEVQKEDRHRTKQMFKVPVNKKVLSSSDEHVDENNSNASNIDFDDDKQPKEKERQPLNFTLFFEKQHGKGPLTSTPCISKKPKKRKLNFPENIANHEQLPGEQKGKVKEKKRKEKEGLSIRYWNGMNGKERRIADVIDLDVILDSILKTLQDVVEEQEFYICERAVKDLMDYLVKGIVYSIEKLQNIKIYKHKINKAKRKINTTRKHLLQVQQRNSELEVEIEQINKHRKKDRDESQISSWLDKLQTIGNKLCAKNQIPNENSKGFTAFGYVPDID